MTAVLIIQDDTFEDAFIVKAADAYEALHLAIGYLRVAQPAVHTGRLVVPTTDPVGGWKEWLDETLMDIEDISVEIYTEQDGTIMPAQAFRDWIFQSQNDLYRQHTPHVVDVVHTL